MEGLLTKEQILAADDIKTEEVGVPEWGGSLIVKAITAAERDLFDQRMTKSRKGNEQDNMEDVRASLCVECIIGSDGKRMFTKDDIVALSNKSGAALDRVFAVAQRLAGMDKADLKELAKNS